MSIEKKITQYLDKPGSDDKVDESADLMAMVDKIASEHSKDPAMAKAFALIKSKLAAAMKK